MRPLVCVLALSGCNWLYGLSTTTEIDAREPDAAARTTKLSFLVGPVDSNGSNEGEVFAAHIPNLVVKGARFGVPLVEFAYANETVSYPFEILGETWRMEYKPFADEPPYELQWNPADGGGRAVVPLFGRVERTQVMPSTGYTLNLGATTFSNRAVIYTSGYWTATRVPAATTTPAVDFATAVPLSGARGAPADKDTVAVIDYTVGSPCTVASRVGSIGAPPVVAGSMQAVALTNDGGSASSVLAFEGSGGVLFGLGARISTALGSRDEPTSHAAKVVVARVAHSKMPAFTSTFEGVPAPVMIPLATCTVGSTVNMVTTPVYFDAGNRLAFPKLGFAYYASERSVSGVTLRSSIASVAPSSGTDNYVVAHPVGFATAPKLGAVDLADGPDRTPIPASVQDLTFTLETGTPADYVEVTLYRLAAPNLVPVRVYIAPNPAQPIKFDPAAMTAGQDYVFAIRTFTGRPQADQYNFDVVAGTQSVATIFTRTFTL
jgi:hypothetical protein